MAIDYNTVKAVIMKKILFLLCIIGILFSNTADAQLMHRKTLPDEIEGWGFSQWYSDYSLSWAISFGDSIAANDSLDISLTPDSPIGTAQALFIDNQQGVAETVAIILEFVLPDEAAILSSIDIPVWTETTDGTDYVAFSVWDDSTYYDWKSKLTANADDSTSTVARTTNIVSISNINITGGRVRLYGIVKTESDSAFVGVPKVNISN